MVSGASAHYAMVQSGVVVVVVQSDAGGELVGQCSVNRGDVARWDWVGKDIPG